jgi:Ca2+-transporting ATPase
MTALSLAVAAIPEALPAVVTVSLALGARTMARRNALVNRLPAVETLGSVTYICADKTGTLTQNRMRVEAAFVDRRRLSTGAEIACAGEAGALLLQAMALSNDAERAGDGTVGGDPTEVALLVAAADAGVEKAELTATLPRVAELPFSSERARMTTVHRDGDGLIAFTKGAPEPVLQACVAAHGVAGSGPLDAPGALAMAAKMARDGLRVLAVAMRRFDGPPGEWTPASVETGQTFLGLVGLLDPPRPEAKAAVGLCQSAGIRVVMITGDHPATAEAIARTLGISAPGDPIVTGAALVRQPAAEFAAHVRDVRVYARVAPEQKIQIVEALQRHGELVAMTGDGVNDAPALRRADIGVAMGRGGTDVARQAAHMVLLDDNFATIVSAVVEGRRIYDDIRKFVRYVLTGNSAEIWTLFLAPLVLLPTPLLPIHILWINLVTDGLPGVALAMEPAEEDVMRRPPRAPRESVFAGGLWQHVTWVGLLMGGVTLAMQAWALETSPAHWQSMTFTVLTLSQMGHLLAIRSERRPSWRLGLRSNPYLLVAVGLTFLLQMATLYVPALTAVFKTTALSAAELASCMAASAVVWLGVELEKWMIRRGWLYRG